MRLTGLGLLGLCLFGMPAASAAATATNAPFSDETAIYVRQDLAMTLISTRADSSKVLELHCGGGTVLARQEGVEFRIAADALIISPGLSRLVSASNVNKHGERILKPALGWYSAVCEVGKVVVRLGEGVKRIEVIEP